MRLWWKRSSQARRPAEGVTCIVPLWPSGSPSSNSMLQVLLSAQASPTRLSGMLLIPPVPYCLGPSKWRPLGDPHPGPVQGLRSPGELLHLLRQNHTKVCAHHYPALHGLGWLLLTRPGALPVEQATWQVSSQLIIRNYPSFDIHTMHVCLHVAVLIDEESDRGLCALEQEQMFCGQRLEAALSCPQFLQCPWRHLISSLASAGRPEKLTPCVMVLLALHLARHQLWEPQLLEAIAHFLVVQESQLSSKMGLPVVQKLVLPFGRLNYLPLEQQFMPSGVAPLATVNIWMSLCQLQCLPFRVLHFVFSPGFMNRISGRQVPASLCTATSSLLDTVVELELPGYQGPHLPQRQQVPIFPQPLITDRVHCKYSHKDIVAEGLWQLLGEVPPGPDCASRLLLPPVCAVLPVRTRDPFLPYPPRSCAQGQAASNPTTQNSAQRVELRLHEYWHFCQGGRVLLGSWALREQHLGFMGYQLLPMSGSPCS
uniref:Fas activated serine/threonine kinase n=1 Tax=Cavia porcellus TaxID=10141 RepID=A0A286X7V2_CAVPO